MLTFEPLWMLIVDKNENVRWMLMLYLVCSLSGLFTGCSVLVDPIDAGASLWYFLNRCSNSRSHRCIADSVFRGPMTYACYGHGPLCAYTCHGPMRKSASFSTILLNFADCKVRELFFSSDNTMFYCHPAPHLLGGISKNFDCLSSHHSDWGSIDLSHGMQFRTHVSLNTVVLAFTLKLKLVFVVNIISQESFSQNNKKISQERVVR